MIAIAFGVNCFQLKAVTAQDLVRFDTSLRKLVEALTYIDEQLVLEKRIKALEQLIKEQRELEKGIKEKESKKKELSPEEIEALEWEPPVIQDIIALEAEKRALEEKKGQLIKDKQKIAEIVKKIVEDINNKFNAFKGKVLSNEILKQVEELLEKFRIQNRSYYNLHGTRFDDKGLIGEVENWLNSQKKLKFTPEQLLQEQNKIKNAEKVLQAKFDALRQLSRLSYEQIKELEDLELEFMKMVRNFKVVSGVDYKGKINLLTDIDALITRGKLALRRQVIED